MKLGLSGQLARGFINSPLTPLLLLAALGLGLIALLTIPREEEPQISVPMVDVMVRADGLAAADAVELITEPLEALISGISEVEHVYSQTRDDQVMVSARFEVGVSEDLAVLRVHEEIRGNFDRLPIGVPEPLVVARGINDVPILTLTLSPEPGHGERWNDAALLTLAEELQSRLTAVEATGLSFIVGGRADQVRIQPDPERLALYGVTLQQLAGKIEAANAAFPVRPVFRDGQSLETSVGETLTDPARIGLLVLTTRDGRPVYVRDVADVIIGPEPSDHRVWTLVREDARTATIMARRMPPRRTGPAPRR
jgi:multidrug efflux pump subunit AcrB